MKSQTRMAAQPEAATAAAEYLKHKPINSYLLSLNVVLVLSGAVVLSSSLSAYETIKQNLVAMRTATYQAPCAVATPSARGVLRGIGKAGFSWSPLAMPIEEEFATLKIGISVCESSNVYMAIASVLDNSTMHHVPDVGSVPATYILAENDLVENLCRRDPERDIYGEIRRRIATAYVLANPAFKRYYTTGCMGSLDPFPMSGTHCTYASSVVNSELYWAAQDMAIGGYGTLPPFGNMLYRLLALSVIAERDRRVNNTSVLPTAR